MKILRSFNRKYKFTLKSFKENRKLILYNFVIRHGTSLNEMVADTYPFTLIETLMEDKVYGMREVRFYAKENLTLRDFINEQD